MGGNHIINLLLVQKASQGLSWFFLLEAVGGAGECAGRKDSCGYSFCRLKFLISSQVTLHGIGIAVPPCCCNEIPQAMSPLKVGFALAQAWKKHCLGHSVLPSLHSSCFRVRLWISNVLQAVCRVKLPHRMEQSFFN